MIPFEIALQKVLEHTEDYGHEEVGIQQADGRVLAETIFADRDFPPFDRATKDGIAIKYTNDAKLQQSYQIAGIAPAGSPQMTLEETSSCIEVMTGAIVPKNADTVVMYEHIRKENQSFVLQEPVKQGQNIHYRSSDMPSGSKLLEIGTPIGPAEVGVLATVGKSRVLVKKLPKIAVISTGNELVDIDTKPLPHQIRKSNAHTLQTLLQQDGIAVDLFHLADEPSILRTKLDEILKKYSVLLLSGGVSKGKFDFLPETFNALRVEKVFHRVSQRPGKPFWFGKDYAGKCLVFAFPGNPVSTFVNFHTYFKPWLNKILGQSIPHFGVFLKEPEVNKTDLTLFIGVKIALTDGVITVSRIATTGSGDLLSLSKADGFIVMEPKASKEAKSLVPFIPTKRIM